MDLELQANLYDVEGGYHEAVAMSVSQVRKQAQQKQTYRETRPAIAPATTTCRLEPCVRR
jgi:hypothetical protein